MSDKPKKDEDREVEVFEAPSAPKTPPRNGAGDGVENVDLTAFSPKTARKYRRERREVVKERISRQAHAIAEQKLKEFSEQRRKEENRLRRKYGTPSGANFSRAFRLLSSGEKRGIKLRKIGRRFKNIARDFLLSRSTAAMIKPMYFYYQSKKDAVNILRYFILESGRGDVMLSEMSGRVIDGNITFRKLGSSGPKYDYLFPKLDNIVARRVAAGSDLETVRHRLGRDLIRISGGKDIKGNYHEEELDYIIPTGVILAVDMAREPRAKRYISEYLSRMDISFAQKLKNYAGASGKGKEISYRGETISLSKLGVQGLRDVGEFEGEDGNLSSYSDDEITPRALDFSQKSAATASSASSLTDIDDIEALVEDFTFSQSSSGTRDSVDSDASMVSSEYFSARGDSSRRKRSDCDALKNIPYVINRAKRGRKSKDGRYMRNQKLKETKRSR